MKLVNTHLKNIIPDRDSVWKKEISVSGPPDIVKELKEIATIVSVSVTTENPVKNVTVRFESGKCYTILDWNEEGMINAVVVLDSNRIGNMRLRCIRHEIMPVMGIRGHAFSNTSIMNYTFPITYELTAFDVNMLKYLYGKK